MYRYTHLLFHPRKTRLTLVSEQMRRAVDVGGQIPAAIVCRSEEKDNKKMKREIRNQNKKKSTFSGHAQVQTTKCQFFFPHSFSTHMRRTAWIALEGGKKETI